MPDPSCCACEDLHLRDSHDDEVQPVNYVALLRGINVGGRNTIKMTELKASFEAMGFAAVATYIQSGNVLFRTSRSDGVELSAEIEDALTRSFGFDLRIVVVSGRQLAATVARAPEGFGEAPDKFRYDVIFLRKPLRSAEALEGWNPKPGVDTVHAGSGVIYVSRLTSKAAQSRLTKIIQLPTYQNMTIRNWNTTTKLLALMTMDDAKSD